MSQVIYARVPDTVKEAVDGYADDRGVTLTSAVVDLLERGLAAASDERSIAELETKLAKSAVEKAEVEIRLAAAMNELGGLQAFTRRAGQAVGSCPHCRQPFSGYELLAVGQCTHCQRTLTNLLAPKQSSSLNERELGLLLGALGVALVGAAVVASAR